MYQIQSSTNLQDWEDEGNPVDGTGRLIERFYSVLSGETRVFRVVRIFQ